MRSLRARPVRAHLYAVLVVLAGAVLASTQGLWLSALCLPVAGVMYLVLARYGLRMELDHVLGHELSAFRDDDADPLGSLQSQRSDQQEGEVHEW